MKDYDIWGKGQNTDPSYVHLGSQDPLPPGSIYALQSAEKAFAASWGSILRRLVSMDPLRFFSDYGPHTSYRILLLFAAVYCRLAMEAARKLGVEPVITAREMADPDVDHLGVMAYVARLRSVAPAAVESVHPRSDVSPAPPLPPLRSPSVNHSPPSDRVELHILVKVVVI